MDVKEIKLIIEACKDTEYSYIKIKNKDVVIELGKEDKNQQVFTNFQPMMQPTMTQETQVMSPISPMKALDTEVSEEEDKNLYTVTSPIVGTYYSSASPDSDAFVKVGDQVNASQTVCIIEAMKLMNEIEAEVCGEVIDILVNNEDSIEYGQPLFRIKVA